MNFLMIFMNVTANFQNSGGDLSFNCKIRGHVQEHWINISKPQVSVKVIWKSTIISANLKDFR